MQKCLFLYAIVNVIPVDTFVNQDWHFKGPNIALGKPTQQHPGKPSDPYYQDSKKAVDNITDDGNGKLEHCSHTSQAVYGDFAWWRVDLKDYFYVSGMKIFNRDNSARIRLKHFQVIGRTSSRSDILYRDENSYNQDIITIPFNGSKQYRFIEIRLPKYIIDSFLTLCEVQVFALGCTIITDSNFKAQVTQTSMVYNNYSDGSMDYYPVDAAIRITCSLGYEPTASRNITCRPNREYSIPYPFCKFTTCPLLDDPANGNYVRVNASLLRLECKQGFKLQNGNGIRFCQQGHSWSGQHSICVPEECIVPAINNGSLKFNNNVLTQGTTLNFSSVVYITCDLGFFVTTKYIRCIDNGKWYGSTTEYCRIKICASPSSLKNGYYQKDGSLVSTESLGRAYTFNTVLTIHCAKGYQESASQIRCEASGHWDKRPGCIRINCSIPTFPNGYYEHLKVQTNSIQFSDYVLPVCINASYGITTNRHRRCLANGSLSGETPICVPLCKIPTGPKYGFYIDSNGKPFLNNARQGERIYVNCDDGFETPTNRPDIFCQRNFSWSGNMPICTAKQCQVDKQILEQKFLVVVNGKGSTTFNQSLTLRCKPGYEDINGSSEIRCNNDSKFIYHKGLLQCKAKECKIDEEKLRQRFLKIEDDKDKTTFNLTLILQCKPGYEKVSGRTEIRCNDDTEFYYDNEILLCKEIQKAKLSSVALASGVGGGCVAVTVVFVVVAVIIFRNRNGKSKQPMERQVTNDQKSKEAYQGNEYSSLDETEMNAIQGMGNINSTVDPCYDDEASDYYSFDFEKMPLTAIKIEHLPEMVLSAVSNNEKLQDQFACLKTCMVADHTAAIKTQNRAKNKYKDMYPYDENRVVLQSGNLKSETDYINASYINGFSEPKNYIAAQAPLSQQKTINDFWRMIWQKNVSKIIMLTKLKEEEKIKCDQYWPENESEMYGRVQVSLQQTEYFSEFVVRHFHVSKDNSATRKLVHFHFTTWPDKGVPKYASSLVHFRQKAIKTPTNTKGPIVVHCSAGVGRTGTFIALDILVEQGSRLGYVDVYGCVQSLRKQRVMMVQTLDQYVFIHFALTEALMLSPSVLPASKFIEKYRDALRIDTGKRKIETEFEIMQNLSPTAEESQYISAKEIQNRKKNRYANILPVDEFMPKLRGGEMYINAVFLPSYKEKNAFIITQSPLENTKQEFWKLVRDHQIHTLVMMNSLTELKSEEEIYWPQINTPVICDDMLVSYIGEEESDGHNVISLKIKHSEKTRQIKLLQYCRFIEVDFPGKPESLLSMIELVRNCQRHAGGSPVVVHCMNGADKSGLYCVMSAVIERLKIEQDVAISQTIEIMRNCREQLIISLEQFKFCHDVVLAFINQFETYSNFAEVNA